MPETRVVFFKDGDGSVPALASLEEMLRRGRRRESAKCLARIARLAETGHELRRPEADLLGEGIHELRATHRRQHYRILYFFHGSVAVLSHLIIKERAVPPLEIRRAIRNKARFSADPERHTHQVGERR